jgi:hypothetical protein
MSQPQPLYGYTINGRDPHFSTPGAVKTALCGGLIVQFPTIQPSFPSNVCKHCGMKVEAGAKYAFTDEDDDTPWRVS